jgi:hypothetical protein
LSAIKKDPAGVRHQFATQLVERRGLAGTVGADQGVEFALGDFQGEVVAGLDGTEAFDQRFDRKE